MYGATFGLKTGPKLQITGELGGMTNILPPSVADDVDVAAAIVADSKGGKHSSSASARAMYGLVGVRRAMPEVSGARTFIEFGVGAAKVRSTVSAQIRGSEALQGDISSLVSTPFTASTPTTEAMVSIGGGIILGVTRTTAVEVGYRVRARLHGQPGDQHEQHRRGLPLRVLGMRVIAAAVCACALFVGAAVAPAVAQVVVAGTIGAPETDLTPEQEHRLLGEDLDGRQALPRGAQSRGHGNVCVDPRPHRQSQSIQYQPETAKRPEYLESKAEWNPATLRAAAMLHSDVGLAAFRNRNLQEFEFQIAIADGWFALADNRRSSPGSLRSRWNVTVARLLLANGEIGMAERHLARVNDRISGDIAILLAYGTVKETQASRFLAEYSGGRLMRRHSPENPAPPR